MKRIIALLLAMLAVIPAVSCSEKADDPANSNDSDTTLTEVTEELDPLQARKAIPDDLPNENYDGYTFTVLGRERSDFVEDIGTDTEETGDVIDDAIYHRNSTVEERFNITLDSFHTGDPISKLRETVQTNDDVYSLMLDHCINIGSASIEGNYLDWYTDLPYVNLEKPWYIGNAVTSLSVGNHAYIMAGEYNLSILRFTYCMYFNKVIAQNYNVPNLYEIVSSGKWTIDALDDIVKGVHEDFDGNGKMDDQDLYGFTTDWFSAAITYQYAFNNPVITRDSDGIPIVTYKESKIDQIVERLHTFFHENPGSFPGGWGVSGPIWSSGRALFLNGLFQSSSSYRDLEFDFGIIPYPKWDEAQSRYYTMSDGAHDLMAVPITVSNKERTSVIIEALNAESYKQVIPAYYETALKVKFTRDEESVEVLDLLLAGRTFDFGYIYDGWKGYAFILQDMLSNKKTTIASAIKSKESGAEKRYQDVIDQLTGLAD